MSELYVTHMEMDGSWKLPNMRFQKDQGKLPCFLFPYGLVAST